MILHCPVCQSPDHEPVLTLEEAPIANLLEPGEQLTPDYFAPLDIVRCTPCLHMYNRAFDPSLGDRIYRKAILTNVPVHVSMSKHLDDVAQWIGVERYSGKHVIEVGGGSGHLARVFAKAAKSVTVFEPSAGLHPDMLPEANIELVSEPFASSLSNELADLIECRQVLEHVPDPLAMLKEMRACLVDDGYLYLEVPRAEYIEQEVAVYDLHIPHVQYFHKPNLLALAARAGFLTEKYWQIMGDHDFGVLLRATAGNSHIPSVAKPQIPFDFSSLVEQRLEQSRSVLTTLGNRVALYGANTQAATFVNAHQMDRRFVFAFDDNPAFWGCALFSKEQVIPVRKPDPEALGEVDAVLITAYLHEKPILGRLDDMGFRGEVVRIEPELSVIRQ